MSCHAGTTRVHKIGCLVVFLCLGCETRSSIPAASATDPSAVSSSPRTGQIRIAAAADMRYALAELIQKYEQHHTDTRISVSFGSSGTLFSQLSNRAPFDLFLSADSDFPRKLIEQGQALADSEFRYADGHIIVWVRNDSSLDVAERGIEVLKDPAVRKIAIANPQHAPYGRAAMAALKSLRIHDAIESRLVLGENISQTAQLVESGAADVGIVALSLARAPALRNRGQFWEIPADAYPPIQQAGAVMTWAQDIPAARGFSEFLLSPDAGDVLHEYGFTRPKD